MKPNSLFVLYPLHHQDIACVQRKATLFQSQSLYLLYSQTKSVQAHLMN